ncbi:MAG: hypothetical protein AAGI72_17890 [Pseudomonadota bacterium]
MRQLFSASLIVLISIAARPQDTVSLGERAVACFTVGAYEKDEVYGLFRMFEHFAESNQMSYNENDQLSRHFVSPDHQTEIHVSGFMGKHGAVVSLFAERSKAGHLSILLEDFVRGPVAADYTTKDCSLVPGFELPMYYRDPG